jgi:hypothetical protein
MRKGISVLLFAVLSGLLLMQSCETLDQLTRTLMSLRRLQFKLGGIHDFILLGINLTGKSALSDFSAADGLELVQGFRSKRLPAEFTLDILVQNPVFSSMGSPPSMEISTGPSKSPELGRLRRFRSGCLST